MSQVSETARVRLSDLFLDFEAISSKTSTLQDQFAGIQVSDLPGLTIEIYDQIDGLLDGLTDKVVAFEPFDPNNDDAEQPGWTLGHVIVHLTASLEENASQASVLARGAELTTRLRYETPWEIVTTAAQVRQRLDESRRMSMAFLQTWPDTPHLDNLYQHPYFGPTNATSFHTVGIFHAVGHLPQISEIVRQGTESD